MLTLLVWQIKTQGQILVCSILKRIFYSNKVFFKWTKVWDQHGCMGINNNDGTYALREQQWNFHVQIYAFAGCIHDCVRVSKYVDCAVCTSSIAYSLNFVCNFAMTILFAIKLRFCAFIVNEWKHIWFELTNRECCRTFRIPISWMDRWKVYGRYRMLHSQHFLLGFFFHLSSGHEPALSFEIYQCLNIKSHAHDAHVMLHKLFDVVVRVSHFPMQFHPHLLWLDLWAFWSVNETKTQTKRKKNKRTNSVEDLFRLDGQNVEGFANRVLSSRNEYTHQANEHFKSNLLQDKHVLEYSLQSFQRFRRSLELMELTAISIRKQTSVRRVRGVRSYTITMVSIRSICITTITQQIGYDMVRAIRTSIVPIVYKHIEMGTLCNW